MFSTHKIQDAYNEIVKEIFFIWVGPNDLTPFSFYNLTQYKEHTGGKVTLLVCEDNKEQALIKQCKDLGITVKVFENEIPRLLAEVKNQNGQAKLKELYDLVIDIYNPAGKSEGFAAVSDILRIIYCLINNHAILYSDLDVVYRPLTSADINQLKAIDSFACPMALILDSLGDPHEYCVGNCLMFKKEMPNAGVAFELMCNDILNRHGYLKHLLNSGAENITRCIIRTTGPGCLKRALWKVYGKESSDIPFPRVNHFPYGLHCSEKLWLGYDEDASIAEYHAYQALLEHYKDSPKLLATLKNIPKPNPRKDSMDLDDSKARDEWKKIIDYFQTNQNNFIAHRNSINTNIDSLASSFQELKVDVK